VRSVFTAFHVMRNVYDVAVSKKIWPQVR